MFPLTDHPQLIHGIFEAAALSIGTLYYCRLQNQEGVSSSSLLHGGRFAVLVGCVFGAAVGNKLVFLIEMPQFFYLYWNKPELWFAGQSMVGGLLGGLIGVELAKALYGVRKSTGDAFVFPILLGLMIGRIGCFISGLSDGTFGIPSDMPWSVDFGDGVPRHPAQLYEIIFAGVLWLVLRRIQKHCSTQPGLMFKVMLSSYLLWRLLVDCLKPVPFDYGYGLSGIQIVCFVALLMYLPLSLIQWQRLKVY